MPSKKKEKKPKKQSMKDSSEASPARSLAGELSRLEANLAKTLRAYGDKLQSDLAMVSDWAINLAKTDKSLKREQARDLGDMIGLLRQLKLKPEKGRRRDLRKVEGVLEDLIGLTREKSQDKTES